jgi:hypothetical protein
MLAPCKTTRAMLAMVTSGPEMLVSLWKLRPANSRYYLANHDSYFRVTNHDSWPVKQ